MFKGVCATGVSSRGLLSGQSGSGREAAVELRGKKEQFHKNGAVARWPGAVDKHKELGLLAGGYANML